MAVRDTATHAAERRHCSAIRRNFALDERSFRKPHHEVEEDYPQMTQMTQMTNIKLK
jgi:glycerol-3-phosphate responsive antiterminator